VYGSLSPHIKRGFLEYINYLGNLFHDQQWTIKGYFNIITYLLEKKGGIIRIYGDIKAFRD
jgi:hypothetical protein